MSVKGQIKESAGYVEEETGEILKNKELAEKGRDLRNEGRREDKKPQMNTPVGSLHKEKDND